MEAYESERIDRASQGAVMQQEVEADEFAARYLGRDYVAAGLKMIIAELQQYKDDSEILENLEIAIEELNKRIEIAEI